MLDGFGGLHNFGNAPPAAGASWPGWDIARDLVLRPAGGGWVLDGYGGIHPFGGAPRLNGGPSWVGQDIARKLAIFPLGAYVLDGNGGVHPVAGAPRMPSPQSWPGWDIAKDLVPAASGPGGYLLDGYGGAWPLGGAPGIAAPYYGRDVARRLIMRPGGGGYSLQDDGKLTSSATHPGCVSVHHVRGRALDHHPVCHQLCRRRLTRRALIGPADPPRAARARAVPARAG